MDQKMDLPKGYSMQEITRMANSPAGQQLIKLLQQQGGSELNRAVSKANQGNYEEAKDALSSLMNSPEIMALLKQLGGTP